MYQVNYDNKPSIVTLKAAIKRAVAKGEDFIQLIWGENQITIERSQWGWQGHGWIGKHGGQDLANLVARNQI